MFVLTRCSTDVSTCGAGDGSPSWDDQPGGGGGSGSESPGILQLLDTLETLTENLLSRSEGEEPFLWMPDQDQT